MIEVSKIISDQITSSQTKAWFCMSGKSQTIGDFILSQDNSVPLRFFSLLDKIIGDYWQ